MAKIKGKGTIIKHTISAALTAIAQVTEMEISGSGSTTWESTALDTGVFKTFEQTGYSNPGTFSLGLFFDPALAGHQFITDTITTPQDNAMQITYADQANTTQDFTSAGVEFGVVVAMDDGLRGSATYTIDGDPDWPT